MTDVAVIPPPTRHFRWVLLALLIVNVVMFADALLSGGATVVSAANTDIANQFLDWRAFGFGQLRAGHFPLWCPHIYGGIPYFAGFQAALLYPPNVIYLFLDVVTATNISMVGHWFGLGAFMAWWLWRRRCHPVACFVGALMLQMSGAVFPRFYAGHLSNLCTMTWAPLLFLALDEFCGSGSRRWWLVGVGAIAMQILAGHPQYVYYTGLVAGVYALLKLVTMPWRGRVVGGFAGMYVAAALLTAVQLLPGMEAARESVRQGGLPYATAAMFSLPPESGLTLVTPWLFSGPGTDGYCGRNYLWEMSVFIGVGGLALAVLGWRQLPGKQQWSMAGLLAVIALLALGRHTPVHRVLYAVLPMFDQFRGVSKFAFFGVMFLALLGGVGMNAVWALPRRRGGATVTLAVGAVLALGMALWLYVEHGEAWPWAALLRVIADSGESRLAEPEWLRTTEFVQATGRQASGALALTGAAAAVLAGLLWGGQWRWARGAVVGLVVVEVTVLGWPWRVTHERAPGAYPPELAQRLVRSAAEERLWNIGNPNAAMSQGRYDIWGNDPAVRRRWAELLGSVQGGAEEEPSQYLDVRRIKKERMARVFPLARCRWIARAQEEGAQVAEVGEPLPVCFLVERWRVMGSAREALRALQEPGFDARKEVLLESEPGVQTRAEGEGTPLGSVVLREYLANQLTMDMHLDRPGLLVVTDAYDNGWRATARAGRSGRVEELVVMPANVGLRAVAVPAGDWVVEMRYRPGSLRLGLVISLVTLAGLAGWMMSLEWKGRRRFLVFRA